MILFTYPTLRNQIINQTNKYNYNTTIIFFNPAATSFPVIYCGFKRIIKGIKEKRVLRPKTVVERGGFFFLFYHLHFTTVDYREAGLLINSLIILLYPLIIPLYYPFYNNIIPLFLLLYIINMRVEKSGVSFTYCFELKTMILRQD